MTGQYVAVEAPDGTHEVHFVALRGIEKHDAEEVAGCLNQESVYRAELSPLDVVALAAALGREVRS